MRYIIIGTGEKCRDCGSKMQRRKKRDIPKKALNYYFEIYDYCYNCKKSFDYEEFKRKITVSQASLFS